MQKIDINLKGDGAWPEIEGRAVELPSQELKVVILDNGTQSGLPTVIIRSDDDGIAYTIELTARNFQMIAAAIKGKYGDLT